VTCYMRQMGWLFEELDLPHDKENRKRADAAIRTVLALPAEAHCPEVWAAIKALPEEDRTSLPARVGGHLGR
jgi:hypothetical protein